jgi:hypothetical protein
LFAVIYKFVLSGVFHYWKKVKEHRLKACMGTSMQTCFVTVQQVVATGTIHFFIAQTYDSSFFFLAASKLL